MTAAMEKREPRADKVEAVEAIAARLRASEAVLLTEYRGLKVGELAGLRRRLRSTGAEYRVVKCTLARLAAHDAGLDALAVQLSGPVAMVFCGEDVAAPAKTLNEFAKTAPALVVKGGVLQNRAIDEAAAKALADLPSREQLLGQIAGVFQAPLSNVAALLNAPLQQVAGVLDALADKRGGEAAA